MKTKSLLLFILFIMLAFPHFVFAGDNVKTMAQIMINLNHYPSDSEKDTLRQISLTSTSDHEKTIANAMINLQHAATDADKKKLTGLKM